MAQAVLEMQGNAETGRNQIKCRIPQRLVPGRLRNTLKTKVNNNNLEPGKPKFELIAAQQPRNRPRSEEVPTRPRSAGRTKDQQRQSPQRNPPQWIPHPPAHPAQLARETRQDKERLSATLKRPPAFPKNHSIINKPVRPVIMVPQGAAKRQFTPEDENGAPDKRCLRSEEQETYQSTYSNVTSLEMDDEDSVLSLNDKVTQLRTRWQDNLARFENMKKHLNEQQRDLVELYATLRLLHKELTSANERVPLPPSDDLQIMNVAKLTPDQLLQLCSQVRPPSHNTDDTPPGKVSLPVDVNLLYDMPSDLVATCDESLRSRRAIVDWLKEIISKKAITKNVLVQKVNQFKIENDLLKDTLDSNKDEFMRKINEIIEILSTANVRKNAPRKSINEAVAHQLRTEELTCKISELQSVNDDLRRQLRTNDHRIKNKAKIEELEKQLKEERCLKIVLKDRLSRAEGQVRINEDRASQLEAAWEQAHSKTLTLERTVQQLRDEHQLLQSDFDEQLKKFNDTIEDNTRHLEEIETDRQKLQSEKEDLEKRLNELSEHYKEALKNAKLETNSHVAKLIDAEQKCNEISDEKSKLESKLESMCAQLIESELRFKDVSRKLLESENPLRELVDYRRELESTRLQLNETKEELSEYKHLTSKQSEAVDELEKSFQKVVESEGLLKNDLTLKGEYISELEKQRSLLEEQLQQGESKIESYMEELSSLKSQISQLQKEFGDFENFEELQKMVIQQRMQLQEATEQNKVLTEELQKKNSEIEHRVDTLTKQGQMLEQREAMIKMLSDKDEEQSNILKLLRNNLEIRAQADVDLNQQLMEKNAEVESLLSNVETRKEQISQLEKIIITLEEQKRKAIEKRRQDREIILLLEKKVAQYESYFMTNVRNLEAPTDNLDHLINMLEEELDSPYQEQLKMRENLTQRKNNSEQSNREALDKFGFQEENSTSRYKSQRENMPTKIVMGNFVKKTYISNDGQHKVDHGGDLDQKKAITNIETPKWLSPHESGSHLYAKTPFFKGSPTKNSTKNMPYFLMPNHIVDEKKCKMFKLAGHNKVRS